MDAVVFDFDGLMVDTEWPAFVTAREVFAQHGVKLRLEQWQERIGRGDAGPWTELLSEAVGEVDHDVLDQARRLTKNELTDVEPLMPGVAEILDAAARLNVRTAVASSSSMSWVGRHLDRLDVADRFHAVLTSDQVERAKPWPDLFLAACNAVGAEPTRSLALEDSVHGVAAAKAAGLYCVAVPNRVTEGGNFGAADLVLDSLSGFDLGGLLGG